jgi:hypothetical protein
MLVWVKSQNLKAAKAKNKGPHMITINLDDGVNACCRPESILHITAIMSVGKCMQNMTRQEQR